MVGAALFARTPWRPMAALTCTPESRGEKQIHWEEWEWLKTISWLLRASSVEIVSGAGELRTGGIRR